MCPKMNLTFFCFDLTFQFFYIKETKFFHMSFWVFELVKKTEGPIISEPFDKERETSITYRRSRYCIPTLVKIPYIKIKFNDHEIWKKNHQRFFPNNNCF